MAPSLHLLTATAEDTRAVGRALAGLLGPGDVVSLTGDLGAGKTTLVQGAARGLGVEEPVVSPTFTLVREYRGDPTVYHLDVYRLERLQDVMDLGLDEMLDAGGVVFVEWGDAVDTLLPPDRLQVELSIPGEGEERAVTVTASGRAWAERWDALGRALDGWSGEA